jgi:hypothetical protein
MGTDFQYRSGDQAAPASLARVPLLLGTCADGDVGTSYTFDPGDDVRAALGPGKATALAIGMGAIGRVVASPVTPTYAALPAVSQSGTGPALTIAAIGPGSGANDDAPKWKLIVTSDGARMDVSYDGISTAETIQIPAPSPAVLRGKVDLTIGLDLEGLTLVFTAPTAKTITFAAGSLPAAAAGLHAATATSTGTTQILAAALDPAGKARLLAHPSRLKLTTSGVTASDVPATADIVGFTRGGAPASETVSLSQTAGSVLTANHYESITSIDQPVGQGTGGLLAIGYSSCFADGDEILAATNALLAAAAAFPGAAGYPDLLAGGQYMEIATTGTGSATALTIDAGTSTAEALLGFNASAPANLDTTGAEGSRAFDWLGVLVTFAAGPYAAGESYSIPVQGPRGAVADYVAALTAACDDFAAHPFGYVTVVEDPSTNANARALYDALMGLAATYQHDPDSPVLFDVLTPTALHTASPVKATNAAAIATWETSLGLAFNGAAVSLESVVVDDCYTAGPPAMPGSHRRPATWAAVYRRSSLDRLAGNPCDARAPLVTLIGPDGTRARDDGKSSTKLAGLGGAGFWALKSMADGGTKFAPSATRAGALDRYRSPGAVAFALEASRVILPQLQEWEGTWETDPNSPKAADPSLLGERAAVLEELVRPVAFPPAPGSPKNVANFAITMSAPTVLDDGIVVVLLDFNPLAVAETVRATITATGVALAAGG